MPQAAHPGHELVDDELGAGLVAETPPLWEVVRAGCPTVVVRSYRLKDHCRGAFADRLAERLQIAVVDGPEVRDQGLGPLAHVRSPDHGKREPRNPVVAMV